MLSEMAPAYMFIYICPFQLHINSSDGVRTHRHTRKSIYLFILMLRFLLAMIEDLLVYMSTKVPV